MNDAAAKCRLHQWRESSQPRQQHQYPQRLGLVRICRVMATTSCRSLDGDTEGVAPDKLRQHGLLKAIGSVDVESE